ncbi:MAG: hypothetical protein IJS14_13315 [Lentisphaeria bacterium]|nr:hypothetical protein [Lentisphaeria bacterium]
MISRSEIQEKIKSLQSARILLNAKIESLGMAIKQIDEEIAAQTGNLDRVSLSIQENPYWKRPDTRDIAEFFAAKDFFIADLMEISPKNQKDKHELANAAWKYYDLINPVFKKLAKEKDRFEYDFPDNGTPAGKSVFGQTMKRLGDLKLISYERKKNHYAISPTDDITGEWKLFFDGIWAEYVARALIESAIRTCQSKNPLNYGIWSNVKLKRIDSSKPYDMELDVVVNLRNDKIKKHHIYIFEIKSGRNWRVDRWIDSARLFQDHLKKNVRFITCCTDSDIDPMIFAPYRLCSLQNIEKQMAEFLRLDFSSDKEKLKETPKTKK